MERGHWHGKHQPPLAPPRRAHGERKHVASKSFSASLLDSICLSLDEGGDGCPAVNVVDTTRRSDVKATAPPQFWWAKEAIKPKLTAAGADRRGRETGPARPRHSGYASSTTSSSESSCSSYSFSCSSASTADTESVRGRRSPPPPRQPEEDDAEGADAAAPPNNKKAKKKGRRPCFPGARLRQGSAPSPASFACVLKALFASARLPRKPKTPAAVPSPQALPAASPQQCTSGTRTAETAERRSVRLCPDAHASVVRRRVEELVRSLEEVDEDDEGSDASSDLFELENLGGGPHGHELPVYGTTSLVANRAISQGTAF